MTKKPGIGVVAAGHKRTAAAAGAVLRAGGNAMDAAISAAMMACIAEPVLSAPGGGGFAMVREGKTGKVSLYDFFTQTPMAKRVGDEGINEVHADFGTATQAFHIGPGTSATPGFCRGLIALHKDHGNLDLADLCSPAVAAARDGIEVTPFQHYLSTVVAPILTATPQAQALFAPGGDMLAAGEIFRNPALGDTLEKIGAGGIDDVEAKMIAAQRDRGHLSKADFSAYRVEKRMPLMVERAGSKIYLNPPPAASGSLIAHGFEVLDGHNTEAVAAALNSADVNREKITGIPASYRGTTHVSVIDESGNACAITVSNGEGNGELIPGCGFMLNNMLGEEDVNPYRPGDWPLNSRMSSMMCPTLVEHAEGSITALGSGGSNRIRSAIFHVLVRMLLKNFPLEKAIRAPRLHIERGHLDIEGFFKKPALDALKVTFPDHRIWPQANMFYGGVHGAELHIDGDFSGHGDARRDGFSMVVQ